MEKNIFKKGSAKGFLTLRGEKPLFIKRKHPFVLFQPIALIVIVSLVFLTASYFFFTQIIASLALFATGALIVLSLTILFIGQVFIHWYFHLYVLTDRKILEIWYTPLFSHVVYEILLDKVNCTEVDFGSRGFLKEIIDMGDVMITFDRPTHQEEFVLKDIKNCDKTGRFLIEKLLDTRSPEKGGEMIWVKSRVGLTPRTT